MRDYLEGRIATFLANERQEREDRTVPGEALQALVEKLDATLSSILQFAPRKGVCAGEPRHGAKLLLASVEELTAVTDI